MTTKLRAAAAAIPVAAVIAAAAAVPALTGAQTNDAREITVRMTVTSGAQAQHGRKGETLATGDAVLVRLKMTSPAGSALGTAYLTLGAPVRGFDSVDILHLDR